MGYILTTGTEQDILETIRFVAVVRGSHEVVVAQSGFEILQLARRNRPSLVVWDLGVNHPGETQRLGQWYTDATLRPVPLVLLVPAGQSGRHVLPSPLPQGTTCLVKPVDPVELGLRVGALLDPGHGSSSPPVGHRRQVGDLMLDYHLFQVTVGDKTISLTPTEFKLLRHLMENPGQTFSSEQLLDDVWKYPPGAGSPDVVRIYVKRLRDKIEPDSRQPQYIVTIPGHGYQIPMPETTNDWGLRIAECGNPQSPIRNPQSAIPNPQWDGTLQEILLALQTVTQTCQATLATMAHLVDEPPGPEGHLAWREKLGSPGVRKQAPVHPSTNGSAMPMDEIAAAAQSLNGLASELQTTLTQLRGCRRVVG